MTRQGTVQKEQIYVHGTCASCGDTNVLVYDLDSRLVCAHDYRRFIRKEQYAQCCDACGGPNAVRDPAHRRNEYLCFSCHEKNGFMIRNSVVKRAVQMLGSKSIISKPGVCYASGYGSSCDKNVKPRSAWGGKLLCNTHGKNKPNQEKRNKS